MTNSFLLSSLLIIRLEVVMVIKPWYVKKPVSSIRKTASYVKKTNPRSIPDPVPSSSFLALCSLLPPPGSGSPAWAMWMAIGS
jgi:hypothetical protein